VYFLFYRSGNYIKILLFSRPGIKLPHRWTDGETKAPPPTSHVSMLAQPIFHEEGITMRGTRTGVFFARAIGAATILAIVLAFVAVPTGMAADKEDAQGIVDKANVTVGNFLRNKDYEWLHANLPRAKGLIIYPQVLKAGFFLGGSGGTGVLLVRDEKTGTWSQPGFYTIGSVSFGLAIGGEAAEVVVMVMSQKAVDSLATSKVKLGGDMSFAVGPVGAGAKSNVTADFISFAESKGAYAGLSLEGSYLSVRESLNKAYYGTDVTPNQIFVEKKVSNPGSAKLRETLDAGTAKK
jgi:lipid-binding SYLF domain-containing protein